MRLRQLLVIVLLPALAYAGCRRQADAPQYTNRLINEASPYLQLHAHNPVDWYPWGPEAFEKARREDKPIFLSVGYSTCHWCHVMEEESFSNPAIADYMNAHFVSIKVDREERPDLDRLYMNYVIGVSEGGWPMSVFLTPDLKPFFGANYLPPDDRNGDAGFRTILERISTLWTTDRPTALRAAAEGTQLVEARARTTTGAGTIDAPSVAERSYSAIAATFDATNGGFGGAPKFPRPVILNFLIRYHARTGDAMAQRMVLDTLRGIAEGGIRDQIGGGFHRYTTDRAWQVPHFEKMLYDQAQLAASYVEAFQVSRDPFFATVARDTIDYVLRDMRDPAGGFFSAEDADSRADASAARASEGAYYLWSFDELTRLLGNNAVVAAYHWGAVEQGNVPAELDTQGELKGRNVLSVRHSVQDTAARFNLPAAQVDATLAAARQTLFRARANRPRPSRDEKVLVAWNGLMLSALARAASALDDRTYLDAARRNAQFIESRMFDPGTGLLKRRYARAGGSGGSGGLKASSTGAGSATGAGTADIDGLLEDYAYLVQGLLDLYEASFEPHWLSWAIRLQETQDRLFWDGTDGAYFSTRADASDVLARSKEEYDGAEPSANSVSVMNLMRIWRITSKQAWRDRADATIRALSPRLARSGTALPQLLAGLELTQSRSREIVIAGDRNAADTRALVRLVHDRFMPNRILVLTDDGTDQTELRALVPFTDGMTRRDGRAAIYVCENYACRLPTSDPAVAARLLDTR